MSDVIISISATITLLVGAGYAIHQEKSRASFILFMALTVTAMIELFDLLSIIIPVRAFFWKESAVIAESLLPLFWILSSLTFSRQYDFRKRSMLFWTCVTSLLPLSIFTRLLPLNEYFYAPDFPDEKILFLDNTGLFFYITLMTFLIVALVQFEITLANATPDALWKIKFELLGLGTILTIQVFYYSQALLYRSLNMNYLPARSFLYLVAAALIAYSLAYRRGNVHIHISRQIVFKSVVLISVGTYLVLLVLMGEGMRYFGAPFSRNIMLSAAFLFGIGLLISLLSHKVRREIMVGLHKNFYQQKHDYRTQWLSFTEQLSTSRSGEELLQRILSAYCEIFGISGSGMFLLDESHSRYFLQAEYQMDLPVDSITGENSLVRFMAKSGWVINIADDLPDIALDDIRVFRENEISFIVPLFGLHQLEGFIVLSHPIDRTEVYIYEDYDLMKTISRQAYLAIMHQRLSEEITHAREIKAIGNVATFVAHDLKNLVSNLSLIVENSARHIHNPDFQSDMIDSLGNTVTKMQSLISRLKNLSKLDEFNQHQVNLLELSEKTAHLVAGGNVSVTGTAEMICADESEIQKVILNLVMNAIEASSHQAPVVIEVGRSNAPFIKVIDHGCGIPAKYIRTELFKPFKTTKSKGLGIGLYQCKQIVEAHNGKIEVNSIEGIGSIFTIWFADSYRAGVNYSH